MKLVFLILTFMFNNQKKKFFDTFDQGQFGNIITTQAQIMKFMKDKGFQKYYNIMIIIHECWDNVIF